MNRTRRSTLSITAVVLPLLMFMGISQAEDFRVIFTSVTPKNFDSGGTVSRQFHLNAESYLPMATIAGAMQTRVLETDLRADLAAAPVSHRGGSSSFDSYVNSDPLIDGVVILQGGRVVYEAYPNMQPWQRHFAWSITKIVTSTVLAILAERGQLDLQAPVGHYLPALQESAWGSIPLQHIADMASGIDCLDSDGYQDNSTCAYKVEESLGILPANGRDLDFLEVLQSMQMRGEWGRTNEYVSANTNVLGLLVEVVTSRPFAMVLQELIWQPMGAEAGAAIAINSDGYVYASGGLHSRLRDIARFGLLFMKQEATGILGAKLVSRMQSGGLRLADATLSQMRDSLGDDLPERAAWQWDLIWADGAMFKSGYLGQGLYVDPDRDLVVAWFGTGINYGETMNELLPVTRQLVNQGLFSRVP